jgi:osmotically-inducible protein OsmY
MEVSMNKCKRIRAASAALAAAGVISACAVDRHTSTDEGITAQVERAIASHPNARPPNQIYVEARGHTVYLTGTVYDDLAIGDAKDVARKVPGVSMLGASLGDRSRPALQPPGAYRRTTSINS